MRMNEIEISKQESILMKFLIVLLILTLTLLDEIFFNFREKFDRKEKR